MFILYLVFMLGIGIWFFVRSKNAGEKDYFLGGREMGAWVSGLSAGASDMSAWVLMGMPASIYAYGMGKAWIPVGLFIGYSLSWIFIAPRLRSFSIVCGDSITIPQYLTNRFKASSRALQIISAVIFLVAYTVYSASSIKACGTLFETVLGVPAQIAMYAAAVIIVGYTFLGGFLAESASDFMQAVVMIIALVLVLTLGVSAAGGFHAVLENARQIPGFFDFFFTATPIAPQPQPKSSTSPYTSGRASSSRRVPVSSSPLENTPASVMKFSPCPRYTNEHGTCFDSQVGSAVKYCSAMLFLHLRVPVEGGCFRFRQFAPLPAGKRLVQHQ